MRAFLAELSITTLLITHDAVDAWALADHLSVMERGRVVETGRASEHLSRPRTPLTARLVGVNRLGVGAGPDTRLVAFSPGAVVVTDVHPSACALAHPAAAGLWVHGTVSAIEAVLAGVGLRVRVEDGALIRTEHAHALAVPNAPSLLAEMPPGRRILPGERVCCRVHPDRLADYAESPASA
ncbi:hypothetical protein D9V32_10470 [Mycetocola tolaasinivorans]|uniref:TOBE domain-containing protein n=1 Tax=Mycetocola tolaasinivorans TaxID=76635 RepID=A0A3L7A5H7_9MICO|nr:hypothetical protein [Mycetocola tolaasinivorans]RLP75305.1 hypothetical protein D9V32_10470 [Mycetocola tolaasinivorans]